MTTPAPTPPRLMRLTNRALLKQQARHQGYSVRKLATAAQVPHATVGHLLTGYRTHCVRDGAERIAGVLGLPVDVLFAEVDARPHALAG